MTILPVLIGLLITAYSAFATYRFLPIPHGFWLERTAVATSAASPLPPQPWWRTLLAPFARLARFAPVASLTQTRTQLYWASRAGRWIGWTEADLWGLRLALASAGFLLGALIGGPIPAVLLPAIGFLYPGMRLANLSEQVIRQVRRELPEFVQCHSLLVAMNVGDGEALRRLSEAEGVLAGWVRETLARAANQLLFTHPAQFGRPEQEGFFLRRARESGLSELVDFAVQMDLIHQKGAGAKQMLDDLAASAAADQAAALLARAETLGDKLVFPVMLFYFLPYLAALLLPLFAGLGALTQ